MSVAPLSLSSLLSRRATWTNVQSRGRLPPHRHSIISPSRPAPQARDAVERPARAASLRAACPGCDDGRHLRSRSTSSPSHGQPTPQARNPDDHPAGAASPRASSPLSRTPSLHRRSAGCLPRSRGRLPPMPSLRRLPLSPLLILRAAATRQGQPHSTLSLPHLPPLPAQQPRDLAVPSGRNWERANHCHVLQGKRLGQTPGRSCNAADCSQLSRGRLPPMPLPYGPHRPSLPSPAPRHAPRTTIRPEPHRCGRPAAVATTAAAHTVAPPPLSLLPPHLVTRLGRSSSRS